jgi:hypothetical protein
VKSGGDDDPAEFDGHIIVGGFGLRRVPAGPGSVAGHVVGGVAVQGAPEVTTLKQINPKGTVTACSIPHRDA